MQYKNTKNGFTIIEVLVVLAIFVVILGALVGSLRYFYRSNTTAIEQSFAVQSARRGIENIATDIREATYSDEGSYPVISMATSSFSFYSDIDSDIFIEKVRYFLDGTDVKRGVIDSSGDPRTYDDNNEVVSIISENVRNASESTDIFTYYDTNGSVITSTASTTNVRFVDINIIVNTTPARGLNNFTLNTSATLRNVRNED